MLMMPHRRHHRRVAVPRRRDPDARGHVEVHRPVGRRDRRALAALDDEVAEALDAGEQPRRPGVGRGRVGARRMVAGEVVCIIGGCRERRDRGLGRIFLLRQCLGRA